MKHVIHTLIALSVLFSAPLFAGCLPSAPEEASEPPQPQAMQQEQSSAQADADAFANAMNQLNVLKKTSDERQLWNFYDGSFDKSAAYAAQADAARGATIDDSNPNKEFLDSFLEYATDPENSMLAWDTQGDVRLTVNQGDAMAELRGAGTYIRQMLLFDPAVKELRFEVTPIAAQPGDALNMVFRSRDEEETVLHVDLATLNLGRPALYRMSLQNYLDWHGEVDFVLTGDQPAVLLDDMAVLK